MTRILYWNIQQFGINKIDDPANQDASFDRFVIIGNVLRAALPDIFIIVEPQTSRAIQVGRTAPGAGFDGSRRLITFLNRYVKRMGEAGGDWSMVPPLKTGTKETVSVFYRHTNRFFTGPNIWTGRSQRPRGGRVPRLYPNAFRPYLQNRNTPNNSLHNRNKDERKMAARVEFLRNNAGAAGPILQYAARTRAPFMTTFTEVGGAVNPRHLSIFSVHSPASGAARNYLQNLANHWEIARAIDPREVRVIVGDFNWELMDNALNRRGSYGNLVGLNYGLGLDPLNPAPGAPAIKGYKGNYATHIRAVNSASYYSKASERAYYPGYRYIGKGTNRDALSIDNTFTKYGGTAAPGPNPNFTIMNNIAGTPFNVHPEPDNRPQGSVPLWIDMDDYQNPPAFGPNHTIAGLNRFRLWKNYGKIRGTSDHLALSIDV